MSMLYNAYVRPKMECNTIICSPEYANRVKRTEKIQLKMLKYLEFLETGIYPVDNFSYEDACLSREYVALETRRHCILAVFALKILMGNIPVPTLYNSLRVLMVRSNRGTRQNIPMYLPTMKNNFKKQNPIYKLAEGVNWLCTRTNNTIEQLVQLDKINIKIIILMLTTE